MSMCKALLTLISAVLLAGCQTKRAASVCDGWECQTPAAATRQFIIANDRPFANQVASHNSFGSREGCW